MRQVSIRELRALLSELDATLSREGELTVTRHGKEIARILPAAAGRTLPSHRDFLRGQRRQKIGSEVLIREDRDSRG